MTDYNNTQHIVWHDDAIIKQLISYAVGCMLGRYQPRQDTGAILRKGLLERP